MVKYPCTDFEKKYSKILFWWKIQIFANLSKKFLWIKENLSQTPKHYNFNAISVLKKVNLNLWQTCHHLFQISGVPAWFRSHHIFEWYPVCGYRASTMSHQTAPTPHYRQPSPLSVWQHNHNPFERELYSMVKLPTYVENQGENLYGWGTITCKITITKPRV